MGIYPDQLSQKKILISPLDWGMGHTTRCVALVRQLLAQNNEVFFAGNEEQCNFMFLEFKQLQYHFLQGYEVTLDSQKSAYWQLINQFAKIKSAIAHENKFAEKFALENQIDVIISDNRYGLYSGQTKNILLTHQLNLQLPYFRSLVNKRLKRWIEKFDCIWVPDRPENPICGNLIQGNFRIPKVMIGFLTRFKKMELPIRYDYVGIVSGPQPERTRFAIMLMTYLQNSKKKVALVGFKGLDKTIDYYPSPDSYDLEVLINSAETIISRAGYTSIMELMSLNKEAILVPTPGQFEQEYLAETVSSENIQFVKQSDLFQGQVKLYT